MKGLINEALARHTKYQQSNATPPACSVRVYKSVRDFCRWLEKQMTMRKCSSLEEKKFKQEVDSLKKSKERLGLEIVCICV